MTLQIQTITEVKRHYRYRPHRHHLQIKLEIIETIFRGSLTKAEIARGAHLNDCNLSPFLKALEQQGFVVSVEADFRRGLNKQRGMRVRHYSVTERAKMWRLVMQRAEELAPK